MSRVSDPDIEAQSVKEPDSSSLNKLSTADESYLCLLCLRDSTERISMLYFNYIKLRQAISRDTPAVLIGMLMVLQEKYNDLQEKLLQYYPENMAVGKWHDRDEQNEFLGYLDAESRESLQQICMAEMQMILLISRMMEQ